jgi:hypothetical protein
MSPDGDWVRVENGAVPAWSFALGAAFVSLIVLRAVAARRLQAGDGRLAPFLFAPTVLLILFPIVAIALSRNLGLLGVVILAILGLNAFLLLRPVFKAARMARSGSSEKVFSVMSAELGEALLGSVALGLLVVIVAGVALVIYAVVTGGR